MVGILLHYLLLVGFVALLLWLIVPRATDQVPSAIGTLPSATKHSSGVKQQILAGLERRLRHLPTGTQIMHPAVTVSVKAFEVIVGIFFTLATAAYWVVDRDRFVDFVASMVPRPKRKTLRDTWTLIDGKLGAFVRGQGLLIVFVAAVLSGLFFAVGSFAGIVEIIPVIGPLAAGALAIGVGLTQSINTALAAGACVLGVRLAEN